MKYSNIASKVDWVQRALRLGGISVLMLPAASIAQPAQKPLMSRDGGGVPPNIVLTMDDSGSMMFQHMPENTIYADTHTVANPIGGNSIIYEPNDNKYLSSFFDGVVAAQPGSSNYRQRIMRSADTNSIYYNPEVRYEPWANGDGTRKNNSPVAAAYRDPMNPGGGGTINLTNVRTISSSTTWCFRGSNSGCSDTSSSTAFDPGLYYRLQKDSSGKYKDPTNASNYTEYTINTVPSGGYPRATARTDCVASTTSCSQAEERQNFANWFTYYRTRNFMAKGGVAEAFKDAGNGFRLGWGRINQATDQTIDGVTTKVIEAGVREFSSTTKSNFYNWLFALPASGGTPLPRAMDAVGTYYKRSDSKGPWADTPGTGTTSDKTCRRAYHIMVTDGYWNSNVNTAGNSDATDGTTITASGRSYKYIATRPYKDDNSNMLADYAMKYWKQDLRTDLDNKVVPSADNPAFWQHMVNFTVGLGVRGTLQPDKLSSGAANPNSDLPALTADPATTTGTKSWGTDEIDDLWHAALNSRGETFSARDPKELAVAIKGAIGTALQRELREAGVAAASTVLKDGNRKYVPLYVTGDWTGDVQSYRLDSTAQAGAKMWAASDKIPAAASRNIWTWRSDTSVSAQFTYAAMGAANQTALGASDAATAAKLVDYLRGVRTEEGDGKLFRARKSTTSDLNNALPMLGDFVNSNPVLVKGSLNMGYTQLPAANGGSSYAAFLTSKAARNATLFVGANDGMLHAFKDTLSDTVTAEDGKEVFAYVPRAVYPNLKTLSDKLYGTSTLYHQFFVDGALAEHDAYINAPGATTPSWRNLVLGSLGAGGRAVFALDVTSAPSLGANTVKWEISSGSDTDIGYVSTTIEVGVLPTGEWVALFGNGRFSDAGKAALFIVNLNTGTLRKVVVDSVGSNGLGGVSVLRDNAGFITNVYAGDMKGKLWKFKYDSAVSSGFSVDGGTAMFSAISESYAIQPITQAPTIIPFSKGGYLIVVGTGALATEADANSTDPQALYAVWDKPGDTETRPMLSQPQWPAPDLFVVRTLSELSGADVSAGTFYGSNGSTIDWESKRGWKLNLQGIGVSGLRVAYPSQRVLATSYVLLSAVAPANNPAVCESASGAGLNLLVDATDGTNPSSQVFDTNGDGVVNSSDRLVAGYKTGADGIDAIVSGEKATCSGSTCKIDLCILNTTGRLCGKLDQPGPPSGTARTVKDRIWRRIINPPVR